MFWYFRDLDLVISTSEVYNKDYLIRVLFQLSSRLRNSGLAATCQVISHAKIPIIKLETSPEFGKIHSPKCLLTDGDITSAGLKFDININSEDGLRAVPTIKRYVEDMPALRPLVLAVKTFLAMRNLNSPASGGLGSYATICIIIGFLKVRTSRTLNFQSDGLDSSTQIGVRKNILTSRWRASLLELCLWTFLTSTAINSLTRRRIFLHLKARSFLRCLKDGSIIDIPRRLPSNVLWILVSPDVILRRHSCHRKVAANDVGRSAQKIRTIRMAFQEAYQVLQSYQLSSSSGKISETIMGVSDVVRLLLPLKLHDRHLCDRP